MASFQSSNNGLIRRVVKMFDFEEREEDNYEPMPRHWFLLDPEKTPGFPAYIEAGFDNRVAYSGKHSFKLQLNGGSAAVRLETGTLAAIPGARYLVTGRVRTAGVEFSRARIVAMFVDQRGALAPNGRHTSELTVSNDQWTSLRIDLPDAPSEAAWIILRLELIQPIEYQRLAPANHVVEREDIRAAAWFDDVAVYQMPLIELGTQSPVNVIRHPQRPELRVRVQDLTGEPLDVSVVLYDMNRNEVARREQPLDRNNPGQWVWDPGIDRLGWYWASLEVMQKDGGVVGHTLTSFAWLGAETGRGLSEADRFMVVAENMEPRERAMLDRVMVAVGPQAISLPIWEESMDRVALQQAVTETDPVVSRLLTSGRSVVLSLHGVPNELALEAGVDADKPIGLFMSDRGSWDSYLQALLAVYGHEVRDWQIGPAGADEAMKLDNYGEVYGKIRDRLKRFVSDPTVLTPWSADLELTPEATRSTGLLMRLPVSVRPGQIPRYAEGWPLAGGSTDPDLTLLVDTLAPDRFFHEARATDLALRMIRAWQAQPDRIAIRQPWAMFRKHEAELLPDPLLAVWSNVSSQLAGRRFVGRMSLGEGVETYLLDGPGGGVLVAWASDSERAVGHLDLYLGESPVKRDIFGNVTPLERVGNKQKLELTQTPVFVEGINMRLARLRTGFRLNPPWVESVHATHRRELRISNPWPQTITGRLRIDEPSRWSVNPSVIHFSIAAGQTQGFGIQMTLPINVLAGPHELSAHFELEADRAYVLDLHTPVEVGLEDIEFKAVLGVETRQDQAEPVVVIEIEVTNLGQEDDSFYAFAMPPGMKEEQKLVAPLRAGESVTKRFNFFNSLRYLSGQSIRVGLRQIDGPAVLNKMLQTPVVE
ncbi:MAG: hypothetical protein ACYTGQ_03925 [Planctomycetota bacterium]|jgi:hypothetical protein